ncbi:allophanate hydrolase subunit 1 [Kutzneria sp. CA-103260]|nr:allophanate hydrolase subunit 1 [Kutzneria sp. CA-103260]
MLVELDSLAEVEALHGALLVADLPEVVELVPAATTVLVEVRPGSDGLAKARAVIEAADLSHPPDRTPRQVRLPILYDGPDLPLVAETAGLSVDEVVALHCGAEYTVAFCGFAPGFGYLVGLPEPLRQARLDNPRTKVPAGSVGIAGEFTGAYPTSSPGGWRLIGRTTAILFDAKRSEPALLAPGDHVRFEVAG